MQEDLPPGAVEAPPQPSVQSTIDTRLVQLMVIPTCVTWMEGTTIAHVYSVAQW